MVVDELPHIARLLRVHSHEEVAFESRLACGRYEHVAASGQRAPQKNGASLDKGRSDLSRLQRVQPIRAVVLDAHDGEADLEVLLAYEPHIELIDVEHDVVGLVRVHVDVEQVLRVQEKGRVCTRAAVASGALDPLAVRFALRPRLARRQHVCVDHAANGQLVERMHKVIQVHPFVKC